jgi:phosphoenolpyruvate carboxylase
MADYASLVEDPALRTRFLDAILAEFHRTRDLLAALFEGPMDERRPRMARTLAIREEPLRVLHHQQITLLRQWRAHLAADHNAAADALLPKLLLTINAIASGLRTTG